MEQSGQAVSDLFSSIKSFDAAIQLKKDAIVMHPGPINRGVEIDSNVADGSRSVILDQVSYGIAVRMAVMTMTLGREPEGEVTKADTEGGSK